MASSARAESPLDIAAGERFAAIALKCLHQEYPNHLSLSLDSDADAKTPHELSPAFYGCLDWHSAVHGHWLLVRLLRQFPDANFAPIARAALDQSLTKENITQEVAFLRQEGRAAFERPYGLAWLLQLAAELRQWDDPDARRWSEALRPLESESVTRLKGWIPKLRYPIRGGEHNQTAFSFGLIWDWSRVADDLEMRLILWDAARRLYEADRACPLAYEPSGEDFLSPCLAEADFMRRILDRKNFTVWLANFLPLPPGPQEFLAPAIVSDRADPKLAHLDGLNLSRAWMLENIAHALDGEDPHRLPMLTAAAAHRAAALPEVTGEHYEGGHWLGTFAVYLTFHAGWQIAAEKPILDQRMRIE